MMNNRFEILVSTVEYYSYATSKKRKPLEEIQRCQLSMTADELDACGDIGRTWATLAREILEQDKVKYKD